ncbi:iron chaperone [Humibacter ginsenosidimutans]|nr:DUF1801 domain-containing protein [Humibacter ginsenosidimutans]
MGEVTDYYETLPGDVRGLFDGIRRRALELLPDLTEGRSYGMPALLYRGKGLLSTMQAKTHLAYYPYSGAVVSAVADDLSGYSLARGTVRFSVGKPIPPQIVDRMILARAAEIDARMG